MRSAIPCLLALLLLLPVAAAQPGPAPGHSPFSYTSDYLRQTRADATADPVGYATESTKPTALQGQAEHAAWLACWTADHMLDPSVPGCEMFYTPPGQVEPAEDAGAAAEDVVPEPVAELQEEALDAVGDTVADPTSAPSQAKRLLIAVAGALRALLDGVLGLLGLSLDGLQLSADGLGALGSLGADGLLLAGDGAAQLALLTGDGLALSVDGLGSLGGLGLEGLLAGGDMLAAGGAAGAEGLASAGASIGDGAVAAASAAGSGLTAVADALADGARGTASAVADGAQAAGAGMADGAGAVGDAASSVAGAVADAFAGIASWFGAGAEDAPERQPQRGAEGVPSTADGLLDRLDATVEDVL